MGDFFQRIARLSPPQRAVRGSRLVQQRPLAHAAETFRQRVSTLNGSERFPTLRLLRIGGVPGYRRDVELLRKHFPPGCILLDSIASHRSYRAAE